MIEKNIQILEHDYVKERHVGLIKKKRKRNFDFIDCVVQYISCHFGEKGVAFYTSRFTLKQ